MDIPCGASLPRTATPNTGVFFVFVRTVSGTVFGFDGQLVHVEVDISRGLPMFDIVGLPDASMRESRDRVRAALRNGGFPFPSGRIIVNLAPADIPKTGPACDLAIALCILAASAQVPVEPLHSLCVIGELSLDGAVYGVPGVLPIVLAAARERLRIVTSSAAASEAGLVPGLSIVAVDTIADAVAWLRGGADDVSLRTTGGDGLARGKRLFTGSAPAYSRTRGATPVDPDESVDDLADVKGQTLAKRALEIAAAGEHNLLMVGPPGVGKTMLARRLPSILPPLDDDEHLDVCRIYSVAGLLDTALVSAKRRPFRSPHHSATKAGLLGGARGIPGEVSLAHHGVLFLDEVNEFPRALLESLRQPLEDGEVVLARIPRPVRFPSRFVLVAAANPCPCGFHGDPQRECRCPQHAIAAYRNKLSGPLMDRIDLYVELGVPSWQELAHIPSEERSQSVRERVIAARLVQRRRFGLAAVRTNGHMGPKSLRQHCSIGGSADTLLQFATASLQLSARSVHRTLKVARTIADLAGASAISLQHVQEALAFRSPFGHSSEPISPHMHLPDAGGGTS